MRDRSRATEGEAVAGIVEPGVGPSLDPVSRILDVLERYQRGETDGHRHWFRIGYTNDGSDRAVGFPREWFEDGEGTFLVLRMTPAQEARFRKLATDPQAIDALLDFWEAHVE